MSELDFYKYLEEINVFLNDNQKECFKKYAEFLLEYNKKTNLTAIKSIEEVYLKHFYDSLLLLKYHKLSDEILLDIGSGAGFPGVPLKIVYPNLKLYVLDSNGKKTRFLTELSNILNIDYIVINDRAENYVKEKREQFDVVVARAVTAMPILSELCIPFVKVGGLFIPYKGNIDENIENGKFAIEKLGSSIKDIKNEDLPNEAGKRTFIFIEKKCKTDDIYPRLFDKIQKKPLQK